MSDSADDLDLPNAVPPNLTVYKLTRRGGFRFDWPLRRSERLCAVTTAPAAWAQIFAVTLACVPASGRRRLRVRRMGARKLEPAFRTQARLLGTPALIKRDSRIAMVIGWDENVTVQITAVERCSRCQLSA
jgi:hypothetical protein